MFCSNCGKEVREEAVFCAYCGTRILHESRIPEQVQEVGTARSSDNKKERNGIIIGAVAVVCLCLMFPGIRLFLNRGNTSVGVTSNQTEEQTAVKNGVKNETDIGADSDLSDNTSQKSKAPDIVPIAISQARTGDIVILGKYEQDAIQSNEQKTLSGL